MRECRKLDPDFIAADYGTGCNCNAHDPCPAYFLTICCKSKTGLHQARAERVHLPARLSQTCHLDNCCRAQKKSRAYRKVKQIDPDSRDIFSQLTRLQDNPAFQQLRKKL